MKFYKHNSLILLLLISLIFPGMSHPANQPEVPEWAKKVVWYQIFPERFRNGDPSNDPTIEDTIGSWPFDYESEFKIVPWTSDWYKLQPWEDDGRGFYLHAQRRRYGGDMQGVLDKLDYLQELGINAIYFNPVFESPSLHKYDGTMFHHIDDNFGPDPAGDKKLMAAETPDDPSTWQWTAADKIFLKVVKECHCRGIRVIIDGVFNHVGLNFFAFDDLKKNQQNSRYKTWFTVKQWDDPATEADEFEYECWAGVKTMPEIKEDDENGFAPEAWAYMQAAIRRWMDPDGDGNPADGIDGWRLDVAEKVLPASWKKFRAFIRSVNPDAYSTGEVWWEKWPEKMFNAGPWLQGDMFDAVMNYRFANAATKFFINQKKKISVTEFDRELAQVRQDYPAEANYVLQNLMDSHDTDRLASMIINPDRHYGHMNRVDNNHEYDVRKPNANERQVQKLILLFQMTYLGAPMFFYGDEAGMWGASDPDERKPMLWADLKYENEKSHPFGKSRPDDENVFDSELFTYYKKLIHLRLSSNALMLGDFQTLLIDDEKDVYVFQRSYQNEKIIVAINNSNSSQTINLTVEKGELTDCLSSKIITSEEGSLELTIPAKKGYILKY